MMKEVRLGAMDKVRVWQNEMPAFGSVSSSTNDSSLRRVAIEWYAPRGAYFMYGLLGARFTEGTTPLSIRLEVADEGEIAPDFEVAVANIDRLLIGLPAEYAHAVRQGSMRVAETRLDSGILVFDQAVHGEVGSSAFVFERLAMGVTELLCVPSLIAREEELTAVLDRILRGSGA